MTAAAGRWLTQARTLLDRLEATQMGNLALASRLCADAIAPGGMAHMFGSGHSRIPLEEMFPRYGSYSGFHPMAELSMTNHTQVTGANGQRQAMFIERMEGLADQILANYSLRPPDCMMIFSAGGRGAVAVEMAVGSRRLGLPVIAVTSLTRDGSPRSDPSGSVLADHADVIIDIGTPEADALVPLDGLDTPVGPGSTVVYAAVVNEIKVQTASLLIERGAMPPVITSSSVVGQDRSQALFDAAYADHARRYASRLAVGSLERNGEDA